MGSENGLRIQALICVLLEEANHENYEGRPGAVEESCPGFLNCPVLKAFSIIVRPACNRIEFTKDS